MVRSGGSRVGVVGQWRLPPAGGVARGGEPVEFTLNGQRHELTADDVRRRLRGVAPEPVRRHAVRIGGVVYLVKQAFEAVTEVALRS